VLLTDAGPLTALIDLRDRDHQRCASIAAARLGPLATTWPVVAEAMYLTGRAAGWRAQEALWRWIASGALVLYDLTPRMVARMPVLMEQYRDLPMDLADASLVAFAEERRLRQVFTLDRDFCAYRLPNGAPFELIPPDAT
jgi:predicted nucleic acid-binding protein